MDEFVGEGHHRILEMLCARVDAVSRGDEGVARVVILDGPSGIGKTRVVREMYQRLRATRDPECYWPALEESGGAIGRDPLPSRKSTGPEVQDFVWPAGALPGFAWWQLHCERMPGGQAIEVVAQARAEIEAHLVPVALAWRRAASPRQQMGAKREDMVASARDALRDGGLEVATQVLSSVGVAIPGLGTAASWVFAGAQAVRNRIEEHKDVMRDVGLGDRAVGQRRSTSLELANLIADVAHREVPGVVVIEDAHLMDDALCELLDALSASGPKHPIVVVATAWPENRRAGAYGNWVARAMANGTADLVEMPPLAAEDLRTILWRYAPNTSARVADEAARRYPNPLALEAMLSSARTVRAVESTGGALPIEVLATYPIGVGDIYRDRFRQLPDEIRTGLAIAAGSLPDPASSRVWPLVRKVLAEAVANLGDLPSGPRMIMRGIEQAADDQVWLVPTDVADRFHEALQAQIAYEHLQRELLLPQDCATLRQTVINILGSWIDNARDGGYILELTEELGIVSRWLIELISEAE